MALRMNLFGCRLASILEAIGSQQAELMEAASAELAPLFEDASLRAKATAWLHTLVMEGTSFRRTRNPPDVPDDGGLMVTHVETEVHVAAMHALYRGLATSEWLDLSEHSSRWIHQAFESLRGEIRACGLSRASSCPRPLLVHLSAFEAGVPLFGDDFRSGWSFYVFFENQDIAELLDGLAVAKEFERGLPDDLTDEQRAAMVVRISENGREFIDDLATWLGQIHEAGQDAYVLWW